MRNIYPACLFVDLYRHRYLITQLVRRDVLLKYKGSYLGLGWSFLYPLLLLAAFTLVFGGVFEGRWERGAANEMTKYDLALFIYCGLVIFSPLSEVLTSAPRLLQANHNFVKKIVFPTEILPLVSLLSATVHGLAHMVMLIIAAALVGHAHPSAVVAPLVLLPVWLFTLGLAWFFSAAGVYVRDLAHGMPVFMQFLLFLLPVFYPIDAAPSFLRTLHMFNPLAIAIEDMRHVLLEGGYPDLKIWIATLISGLIFAIVGHAFFVRCKEEFADVL